MIGGWDWTFMIWFLLVTCGVGFFYARRASKNLSEYFLSGRKLPWWALGTSMVATTFAADTPIVIAGWVASGGVARNWLWWSFLFGGTLTVFLFARWWRRSKVYTEVELVALRYEGRPASILRGFKALYLGLILNAIIFGWVTMAMGQVVEQVFAVDRWVALGILLGVTLIYSMLSGLWGVVAADVLQFVVAMLGAIILAVLSVAEVGGLEALVQRVGELGSEQGRDILTIIPSGWDAFTLAVMILILVNWWAVYYPGAEPGGGGYVAQRMFAAKDENHARAGTLWFILAHYVLRPWPWILVGLCAIALEPRFLSGQTEGEFAAEGAYPFMFQVLPVGMLGLVVASFIAAFMSTITTTLNLSASYLVNDFYLPFIARDDASERQKVMVSRFTVALVTAAGCAMTLILESAGGGWELLMELTAGTGLVLILRWLWWRVNAWSEISAMLASAGTFLWTQSAAGQEFLTEWAGGSADLEPRLRLLLVIAVATPIWILVTFLTKPVSMDKLQTFYRLVHPGGAWAPVAQAADMKPAPMGGDLLLWIVSSVTIFGFLLGIGSALFLQMTSASLFLGLGVLGGLALYRLMKKEALASAGAE
ncbi:MAG: sodium:solute symporter family protein [Planctomycetota bacterium]|jgi:SSS family transporter